jgi:hypothetical protein
MIAKHYLTKLLDSQIQYTLLETYQSSHYTLKQPKNRKNDAKNDNFLCFNLKNIQQKFLLEFLGENGECCLADREDYGEILGVIGDWEVGNQEVIGTRFTDAYQGGEDEGFSGGSEGSRAMDDGGEFWGGESFGEEDGVWGGKNGKLEGYDREGRGGDSGVIGGGPGEMSGDMPIAFDWVVFDGCGQYDAGWPGLNGTMTEGAKTDNIQIESFGQTRKERNSILRANEIGRNPGRASDLDQNFRNVNLNDFDELKNYIEGVVAGNNASFDLGAVSKKNETLRESQQRKSRSQRKISTSPKNGGFTGELVEMVFGKQPPEVVDDCIGTCCVNNDTTANSVKQKELVEGDDRVHTG